MDFYIKEEDIHKELNKRRKDNRFVKKIEEYLGDSLPLPFNNIDKNFAVLFRHVFTPDYEIEKFLEKAERLKLEPILIEYKEDKFVPENEDKKTLAKMPFFRGVFKNNEVKFDILKIIDFDKNKGKKISDVETLWGESIISFHHRILNFYYPGLNNYIYDYSDWFHDHGGSAKYYYNNFLALFIYNAVLFDNFRDEGKEGEFCLSVFKPAFDRVKEEFNLAPLICPIQDIQDENNPKWWGYDLNKKEKIIEFSKYKKVD